MRKIVAIVPITMSSLHGLTMRENLLPWWWLPWWWLLNTGHSPLDTGLSGGVVIKPLYMSSVYGGIMAEVCVHVYSEPCSQPFPLPSCWWLTVCTNRGRRHWSICSCVHVVQWSQQHTLLLSVHVVPTCGTCEHYCKNYAFVLETTWNNTPLHLAKNG